jgi:hypothetical protein
MDRSTLRSELVPALAVGLVPRTDFNLYAIFTEKVGGIFRALDLSVGMILELAGGSQSTWPYASGNENEKLSK